VVALLSCFVFQEKTDIEPIIPPKLEQGRDAIIAISDRVGRVQDFHKVAVEDFRSNLKFGLVEVVYEWAKGMVGPALQTSVLMLNKFLAIRTNHNLDRCRRRDHCSCNHAPRRDVPRSQRCCSCHWGCRPLQEDGRGSDQDQTR
jgi:DSHCT (NUC185) domain